MTHGEASHATSMPRPLLAACAAAVLLSAGWAFMPLDDPAPPTPELALNRRPAAANTPLPLDMAAFHTPLWIAPPPPVVAAAAPPAPPPPPLKLQLLAVLKEVSGYKAMLYDPDTDKLLVLAEGEAAGRVTVARIAPMAVDLRDSVGVRTLSLRDHAASAGGRP